MNSEVDNSEIFMMPDKIPSVVDFGSGESLFLEDVCSTLDGLIEEF